MSHAVVKHLDVYHTFTVSLHQHIFLAKHNRFRIGKFCVWHKIMFVWRNVLCCTKPPSSTMLALETPITCTGNASAFFFAADLPPLSLACCCFWGYSAAHQSSCLHLLQGNFCFAWSAPLFMDLLEFTFIEFNFLSFLCAANANVPACNSVAQSFSMRKFTVCVLVGMVSQTSLKLSYSFPSVDKIRPVSIRSDSVVSLCCTNSSFALRNSFCSLATCVLMSSLQSHCAWKNASMSILSHCVLLRSNRVHCLSQMSLALVQVINMHSATDLSSVHVIMLAALVSSCCHLVSSFFCWGWASAGRTGHFRDHQWCLLGNGHAEALKSAISI